MKRALLILMAIVGASCATTSPIEGPRPPAPIATAGPQPSGRLNEGRALFSARCQRCHALPEPGRLTPEKWPAQISQMSRKSGLSSDQIALVTEYLVTASRTK